MFTEQNTVEQMILDTLSGGPSQPHVIGEAKVGYLALRPCRESASYLWRCEVKLKIDKAAINEAYAAITGNFNEQDKDDLARRAARLAILIKNPERVEAIVAHIVVSTVSQIHRHNDGRAKGKIRIQPSTTGSSRCP